MDGNGVVRPAKAPVSYYEMDAATLPASLRRALTGTVGEANVSWGVTLPETVIGQIARMTAGGGGGQLLIDADARVRLVRNGRGKG